MAVVSHQPEDLDRPEIPVQGTAQHNLPGLQLHGSPRLTMAARPQWRSGGVI
jgi:hypothetical protein